MLVKGRTGKLLPLLLLGGCGSWQPQKQISRERASAQQLANSICNFCCERERCWLCLAAGLSKQFRMKCNRESEKLICNFMAAPICTSSSSLLFRQRIVLRSPGDDLSIVQSANSTPARHVQVATCNP